MPTEFLTDEQEHAYSHYVGPPSTQQLARYLHLDDADREQVNERRGVDSKLGFAVQLTTVRLCRRPPADTLAPDATDASDGVAHDDDDVGLACGSRLPSAVDLQFHALERAVDCAGVSRIGDID